MAKMIIAPFTKEDEDKLYGEKKVETGKCFIDNRESSMLHMYRQHDSHVLHLMIRGKDVLVNTLHVGFLNENYNYYKEITPEVFESNLMTVKQILNI